jgi:AraC family carnitine catabolism transcriptional activator
VDGPADYDFNSPVPFTHTYKTRFGVTPSHDRTVGRVPFQFRTFPNHASI